MDVETVKIDTLISPDYNPRHITPEAMESLKRSIDEFGYVAPIIVNKHNNHILAGNQRVTALKELGYDEVEVVYTNIEDLNREKALNIRLNNLSGDWDIGKLDTIFQDLELDGFDLTLTGFATENLQPFETETGTEIPVSETIAPDLNTGLKPLPSAGQPETTPVEIMEDEYTAPAEDEMKVYVAKGDLFKLGNHYLFCGDSTSEEDVEILMSAETGGGQKADITFTSPPYNTQQGMKNNPLSTDTKYGMNNYYQIKNNKFDGNVYKNYEDNLTNEDYSNLLIKSAKIGLKYSDDVLFNIGVLRGSKIGITNLLHELQNQFLDILIWNKSNVMPLGMETQRKMVAHICELIFCFNEKGNRSFTHAQWQKGTKTNRIDSINAQKNPESKKHKATFPIEFASQIIQDFSSKSVLDLFGGSGTTLIACEQLNRKCYMMELDPYYCQVIINRWETFTGRKAVKIN